MFNNYTEQLSLLSARLTDIEEKIGRINKILAESGIKGHMIIVDKRVCYGTLNVGKRILMLEEYLGIEVVKIPTSEVYQSTDGERNE